ncbi:MAG: hypothetical protein V7711_18625 [Pseudomonadales bacterium]
MGNLLLILGLLFVSLFVLVKVLDGRAKPLDGEQQSRLSKWIMLLVFILLITALFREVL